MKKLTEKQTLKLRRAHRVRRALRVGSDKPRLSVTISLSHVSAQIIDDQTSKTLVASTTAGQKVDGTLTEKATWVGTQIAKKAKAAKIKQVYFDRGAKLYHGRVKALAEAARAEGLEF